MLVNSCKLHIACLICPPPPYQQFVTPLPFLLLPAVLGVRTLLPYSVLSSPPVSHIYHHHHHHLWQSFLVDILITTINTKINPHHHVLERKRRSTPQRLLVTRKPLLMPLSIILQSKTPLVLCLQCAVQDYGAILCNEPSQGSKQIWTEKRIVYIL